MGYIIDDVHVTFTDLGRKYLIRQIPSFKIINERSESTRLLNNRLINNRSLLLSNFNVDNINNILSNNGIFFINGVEYQLSEEELEVIENIFLNNQTKSVNLASGITLRANRKYRLRMNLITRNFNILSSFKLAFNISDTVNKNDVFINKNLVFYEESNLFEGFTTSEELGEYFEPLSNGSINQNTVNLFETEFYINNDTQNLTLSYLLDNIDSGIEDEETMFYLQYELLEIEELVISNVERRINGMNISYFSLGDSDINYDNSSIIQKTVSISGQEEECLNGTKHNNIRYNLIK